jgi:hypothetical protein
MKLCTISEQHQNTVQGALVNQHSNSKVLDELDGRICHTTLSELHFSVVRPPHSGACALRTLSAMFRSFRMKVSVQQNRVTSEVSTAVTMKDTVFWNVTPCGSCKSRRLGGTYRLYHQGDKNFRARNNLSSNYFFHSILHC